MTENAPSLSIVETAGGVCSPMPSGSLQCDAYRILRLPIIFIGDGRLGGISTTLSSLESLESRGYDIDIILQFQGDLENHKYIRQKYPNIPVITFPPLPMPNSSEHDLIKWYLNESSEFVQLAKILIDLHEKRLHLIKQQQQRSPQIFWWPFTQHAHSTQCTVIDSAYGDFFTVGASEVTGDRHYVLDATSSWWTQSCGHGHPDLARSAAYAIGRYGHVLFPENTHELAFRLSEKLLDLSGGWASRVFFSDDGSTALEIAIKMALRTASMWQNVPDPKLLECIGLSGSYHGDTLGAMDLSDPNPFNSKTEW